MNLGRFPRIDLAHLPTPLEPLPRLSERLGGPTLWIKRDDCTGLATGGNKTRKLEFLLADALEKRADVILTPGAYQSNHVRQTAAAAARLGLECHLVLEHRLPEPTSDYQRSGNRFLDDLLGATVHEVPYGGSVGERIASVRSSIEERGKTPYVIPGGGSNAVGALGYVRCALELLGQAAARGLPVDRVVTATGSGGTLAGLVTGFETMSRDVHVLGFSVHQKVATHSEVVTEIVNNLTKRLGAPNIGPDALHIDDRFIGPAYGVSTAGMLEAVQMVGELEGIVLDPVYSGKAMAGLIDGIRQGQFGAEENIVFLHTGGAIALFAYLDSFRSPTA